MPVDRNRRQPRKAQLRQSSTELTGAPKGASRPCRILLARRQLGTTGWTGEIHCGARACSSSAATIPATATTASRCWSCPTTCSASWPRS